MTWRLAYSLERLRAQVNAKWPNRSKDSDGSIGDEGHSARTSDHNPDDHGVVRAIDITHDPKGGFDSYAFADLLLKKQDPRMKYVISNRRIGSGPAGPSPGHWRKYTGINPHDHHCHISCVPREKDGTDHGDDTQSWNLGGAVETEPMVVTPFIPSPPTLRKGDHGDDVKKLQGALHIFTDGDFGPLTEQAVKKFQTDHHLVADGVVGPQTWKIINSGEKNV